MWIRLERQPRVSGRLSLILALSLQVIVWAAQPATVSAQDQPAPNIIITNDAPDAQPQGAFQQINSRLSRSPQALRSTGSGPHRVSFATKIAVPGFYRVFAWWPQVYDSVGNVDIVVSHLRGSTTVTMDQRLRTGQWVPVGIYEFGTSGAQIDLVGQPGVPLLADAIRLQYMGPQQPPLALETDALPVALTGERYGAFLDVLGGTPPYTFAADVKRLPPGFTLDAANGIFSGAATAAGTYQFDVEVFDHSGQRALRTYVIEVIHGPLASTHTSGHVISPTRVTIKDGVSAGTPPNLSNLTSLVASLPEGEWVRANLNLYSDAWTPDDLRPLFGVSNPNPGRIISAWSSFAWDPNRGDLWLFGGGHANYPGIDVYRWRGSSRMWERASLPSEVKQDDLGNWQAVDGWDAAPVSAHTYDNNMFFPHIDRFVVFGGAAYNSGGPWKREVTPTSNRLTGPFFFDPSRANPNKVGGTTGSHVTRVAPHPEIVGGNMWANRDMYVQIPSRPPSTLSHVNGCTAYADESGKDVAYIGATTGGTSQLNLYKYTVNDLSNPQLDTFAQIGVFWNGSAGRTACGIDPVRKLFVRINSQAYPFVYWNLATPGPNNQDVRVVPADPSGEFATLLSSGQITMGDCALDFDPMRARFLLWCGDGRVWVLTPPAAVSPNGWTIVKQRAPTLATPNGNVGTGLLGKWKYIPNIDAFMGLQDSTLGNIWIYKPIGWVNPVGGITVAMLSVDVHSGTGTSSNLNDVFEPGETIQIEPGWRNITGGSVALTGAASNFTGPAGATYSIDDGTADYGTVAAGAGSNCYSATVNCYRMNVSNPATRPALHWDARFDETLSTGGRATHVLHIGHSFPDVPDANIMYQFVETLLHNEVTLGYGDGTFRPAALSSRAATAMFVARGVMAPNGDGAIPTSGLVGTQPYDCIAGGTSVYVDVLPTDVACKHVHFIASKAVNVRFQCTDALHACPGNNTTRAAMAVLVAGATTVGGDAAVPNSGTYTESGGPRSYDCGTAGGSHFPDIVPTDAYCRHVNYLWALGVIDGYPDGTFHPAGMVTRGQIAKFITNGFGLSLD